MTSKSAGQFPPAPPSFEILVKRKYRDMTRRVGPRKNSRGVLVDPGRILPFDLGDLIVWIQGQSPVRTCDRWQCIYCKRTLVFEEVELEHATPLARAGGVGFDNLVISCQKCNRAKGEFTAEEFLMLKHWARTSLTAAAEAYLWKCLGSGGQGQRMRFTRGKPRNQQQERMPSR